MYIFRNIFLQYQEVGVHPRRFPRVYAVEPGDEAVLKVGVVNQGAGDADAGNVA